MGEELDFAISLAKRSGEIIRKNFHLGMSKEIKEDFSPVTETDREINRIVIEEVSKKFPEHSVLGEEKSYPTDSEYVWICDPVDGTIPYSHGLPHSLFLLALVYQGRPVLGVMYDPFNDRLFCAEEGKGATLNGKPIHVSRVSSLQGQVVGMDYFKSMGYLNKTHMELLEIPAIVIIHCIGLLDSMVIAGEFVATLFVGTHPWDSAAQDIIVREAGGRFTDLTGKMIDYRKPFKGHLASNGLVHDVLLEMVKKDLES